LLPSVGKPLVGKLCNQGRKLFYWFITRSITRENCIKIVYSDIFKMCGKDCEI
jgi:hypothetical protein